MTAVEWLIEQICGEHTDAWKEEIKQSLEMEKQQIIDAYIEGYSSNLNAGDSEKYYNETYKPSA
jgi:hypothetical protein